MEAYKSPRKIAEEERLYKYRRFETYMSQSDEGKISRALALAAFKDEVEYLQEVAE